MACYTPTRWWLARSTGRPPLIGMRAKQIRSRRQVAGELSPFCRHHTAMHEHPIEDQRRADLPTGLASILLPLADRLRLGPGRVAGLIE
jgi:hypothetical protein